VKEIVGSNASVGGIKTSPNNLSQGAACGTLLSSHRKNAKAAFFTILFVPPAANGGKI
jgi:hypothetical protein